MSLLVPLQPENNTWPVLRLETEEDSLAALSDLAVILLGFLQTTLLLGLVTAVYKLPGHDGGGLVPLYVKEHYSLQTSQNPLDPYSISHVTHGALGFIIVFLCDLEPGLGFLLTMVTGVMWEAGENTDFVINLFRETSGPSEDYRGDSKINVVGDVLSCSLGYSLSYILSRHLGGSIIPALLYLIISELYLAVTIRDNILIIGLQLLINSELIKDWQLEAIPTKYQDRARTGYLQLHNMKSKQFANLTRRGDDLLTVALTTAQSDDQWTQWTLS